MEISTHHGEGKLQQIIEVGSHRLTSDASVEAGGEATGPELHDLLAAALGACTALTLKLVRALHAVRRLYGAAFGVLLRV